MFFLYFSAVIVFTYSVLMASRGVRASFSLHSSMLLAVLKAPLSFFDTTPMGRIMNRFSRDIDTVDTTLPELLESWLTSAFNVLATVIILCYATPIFIAVAIPLAVFYYLAQVK
jgi:ATP-binding cassette, subfamily C (CFTR/MRP), member 2